MTAINGKAKLEALNRDLIEIVHTETGLRLVEGDYEEGSEYSSISSVHILLVPHILHCIELVANKCV